MLLLVKNIGRLVGAEENVRPWPRMGREMDHLAEIEHAFLLCNLTTGLVEGFGSMTDAIPGADQEVDARGGWVLPSFCDSHTHIVYAGSREGEFLDKISGLTYEEIARRGGGILNSSDRLHEASEEELFRQAMGRVNEMIAKGTGAMEIKSGYGLSLPDELKMLRVIARIRQSTQAVVRATFLGAHAVGRAYQGRQGEYVDHIVRDMLPAVAAEGLADFVDVFCDEGFFTPEETSKILEAAAKYGIRPKIHANELAASGGVQTGIAHGALSVDHLERATEVEIAALLDAYRRGEGTMPTALPGTSFFLNLPYAPTRKMIEAGLPVALASDYNPGSTPSGDMKFVASLGCIKMRLRPAEALNATTINGAFAMDVANECGTLAPGKLANFYITPPIPSLAFIPYAYTTPLVERVFLRGKEVGKVVEKG